MASRDELIKQLSQNFSTQDEDAKKDDKNRYQEDTMTLVSGKDAARMAEIKSQQKKTERIEIALEVDDYADLILGKMQFYILKGDSISEGDTLMFREFNNFNATGNMNLKQITYIKRNCPGITPGYCVVAWN